jgi:hypothetical protein
MSVSPTIVRRSAETTDAADTQDLCCALYNQVFNQVVTVKSLGVVKIYQAEVQRAACVRLSLCYCLHPEGWKVLVVGVTNRVSFWYFVEEIFCIELCDALVLIDNPLRVAVCAQTGEIVRQFSVLPINAITSLPMELKPDKDTGQVLPVIKTACFDKVRQRSAVFVIVKRSTALLVSSNAHSLAFRSHPFF